MFKRLAALMIVLIFSGSIASTAEESQVKTNIIAEAIADVMRDVNGMSGSVIGYFFNRIGSDSVGTRAAPIPTESFLGKSPAYVTAYTVNYQAKQRRYPSVEVVSIWCLVGILFTFLLLNADENERGGKPFGDRLHDMLNNIGSCCLF